MKQHGMFLLQRLHRRAPAASRQHQEPRAIDTVGVGPGPGPAKVVLHIHPQLAGPTVRAAQGIDVVDRRGRHRFLWIHL